jgi:methionine biosynthesis protein MetW
MIVNKNLEKRLDLEIITNIVNKESRVLDIGCGNGDLLKLLKDQKKVDGRGLEISQICVSKAVARGISVIHGDAAQDLPHYPDDSFDYAILAQTIQAMIDPKEIIKEMLRIANYAIISFPNFAYFKNRLYLLAKGKMPVRKTIPYQWYDTPNIHFCSIDDFKVLCQEMKFLIKDEFYLKSNGKEAGILRGKIFPNLLAEFGLFVVSRDGNAMATQSEFVFNKKYNRKVENAFT